MDIFVYVDESGVLDKKHEQYYAFGGLIFLSKKDKDIAARKYLKAERTIRNGRTGELKASKISNKEKAKLFRSLNNTISFGVVIKQERVLDSIFLHKKSKQRYLDYVFKLGLKTAFQYMNKDSNIPFRFSDVKNIYIFCDEHTTATNGRYELQEALQAEFKYGTHNMKWNKFYAPIFPQLNSVDIKYCNSERVTLIRAADIIANRIYYCSKNNKMTEIQDKIILSYQP